MRKKILKPIYVILLVGLILRLINLDQSLWLDEAINVLAAKNLGFWHFVTGYPIGDFHPPGYFALLWIWGHIFGFSEIAVRMPSVLLGVATIYLTYLIGKNIFDQKTGLLASLFLAVLPLHVYYSQEARMYSLAAFAVALSFWALINLLADVKRYKVIYICSLVLVLLSDYVAYLAIPVQLLYILFYYRRKFKLVLLLQFIAGLIFSPWLLVFPSQLISGRITAQNVPGWAKVVGGSSAKSFALVYIKAIIGKVTLGNKLIYGLVLTPVGVFYLWLISLSFKKKTPDSMMVVFWTFLSTLIAFLLSFFIPALSYFRMLFILPGLCLLIAYSVLQLQTKWRYLSLGAILTISLFCLAIYYTNPVFQRENWKGLESYFENQQSGAIVLFENNEVISPFKYYLQNVNSQNTYLGGLKNFPAKSTEDVIDINESDNKIFLVDYLVGISDPNRTIDQKLTSKGYKVVRAIDFPSLGIVYEYQK